MSDGDQELTKCLYCMTRYSPELRLGTAVPQMFDEYAALIAAIINKANHVSNFKIGFLVRKQA